MAFFNKAEAFGLPAGTVRAILALGLVAALIYAVIWSDITGEALAILSGAAGSAMAFYFAKREGETGE